MGSKHPILSWFYGELNKCNTLNLRTGCTKKATVYDNASELYNGYIQIYFNQYMTLSDAKKENWVINMILKNYFSKDMIIVCGLKIKMNPLIKKN